MKPEKQKQTFFCKDCSNHLNEHNDGANGKILCKCKFDEIDHLMNYESWFRSSKEAEEAKEIIGSIFDDKDFEFKVDWEGTQKNIITVEMVLKYKTIVNNNIINK